MIFFTYRLRSSPDYNVSAFDWQMRARYGTGDFLKLQKRRCSIRLKLTPYGADFLQVIWDICGNHHVFYPSPFKEVSLV